MNLHAWLDSETGRSSWLADQLGVSRAAVSLWRDNGVPMEHWARIVEVSAGDVTLVAMAEHAMKSREANAISRAAAKAE